MRKTLTTIVTIALLLIFTSSYNGYNVDTDINSFAPNFEIKNSGKHTKLSETRGNYVLVNFWSSNDAESRIRNIKYDRFFKANKTSAQYIAVNYDQSENLYKEIVNIDGLSSKSQFFDANGSESEVYKDYHLKSGLNSYLLDREGKIVAINPTMQQLTNL